MTQSERVTEARLEPGRGEPRSRTLAFLLAFLLALFSVGSGHVYLGQGRRAAFWICAPILAFAVFIIVTILTPIRIAFSAIVAVVFLVLGLTWVGGAVDVLLLPRVRFRRVAWWTLPLAWLASLAFSVSAGVTVRTAFVK